MMLRKDCTHCERVATLEIDGRYYCAQHALEKVKTVEKSEGRIPPAKMVQK